MGYRTKYLQMVARMRARLSKTSTSFRRWVVAAAIFVFLIVIMSIEIGPFGYLVEVGKPSTRTIIAPRTVQFVDKAKTREQQDAAAAVVQEVFTYDGSVVRAVESNLNNLFSVVGETDSSNTARQEKAEKINQNITKRLPTDVIASLLDLSPDQRTRVREVVAQTIGSVMKDHVAEDSLEDASERARRSAADSQQDSALKGVTGDLAASLVQPNMMLDSKETEKRRKAARDAVEPVVTTKLQGEVIVNKGEIVTAEQVDLFKSLGFKQPTFTAMNILHMAIFTSVLLLAFGPFLKRYRPNIFNSPGLLALMGMIIVVFTGVAKVLTVASSSLSPFWGYLMPSAAVALMAAVLFDNVVAVMLVISCGIIAGIVTGGNFSVSVFTLLGGLFPALIVSRSSTRHELRRAGLYTSFWVALVAFIASALIQIRQDLLLHTGIGFLNGAVCAIVAMGSLPFLETTFRITTNTWLLELASPEQELLKELSMKAPGTYSHSVMVANLAEAGAREVDSDPLLARVAAYYHDVGKMKRAQFFVENQPAESNPHNIISPNLSSLVIISHVKDGVEMLEKNNFPPELVNIVRQHHGTGIIRYFYEQALEGQEHSAVDESRFRYHFEKPRGKTAGILLLADAVEATARTLNQPSVSTIKQLVDRVVEEKLEDGQLDECSLTFSDLTRTKKVFKKILINAYHIRVEYPIGKGTGARSKGEGRG
ncbi:MAG: HDIG domain-containing protein [Actinobacteria bacterium]|nr:HDIG domain-containing protein [Actinomycetota bacterium]